MSDFSHKVKLLLFVMSLVILSFLAGFLVTEAELSPHRFLSEAYRGGLALLDKLTGYRSPLETNLWRIARFNETGVTRFDSEEVYSGYTLFSSAHKQRAVLIDMHGQAVHEWSLDFNHAWPDPPHVNWVVRNDLIHWRKTHLFPNGDLLAVYEAAGETPFGYGLVKIDRDSNLLWKYAGRTHHDVTIGAKGQIFTLTHDIATEPIPGVPIEAPFFDDKLAILSAEGEELQQISLLMALRDSSYSDLLWLLPSSKDVKGDVLHTNSVDYVDAAIARKHPYLREGWILISMTRTDAILALDPDERTVAWGIRGPWRGQHDPDLLDNGNILVFDNLGHLGAGGSSRVLKVDPHTLEIKWQYVGTNSRRFFSAIRSAQQRLPNGNTLITESDTGRIFEVTEDHDIVWEYLNPNRAGENLDRVAVICWAERFKPETLPFVNEITETK